MKRLFLWIALVFCQLVIGQNFDKPKLDSLFKAIEKENRLMGNFAIFQNGERVYDQSLGYTEVELRRKADKHSLYRIASYTDAFTAWLSLQLIEEGKLNLDEPLDRYFPELPQAKGLQLEDLLFRKSNLPKILSDFFKEEKIQPTEEGVLDYIRKSQNTEILFGDSISSKTDYLLLGYILEKVEEKSYEKIFKKRILKPLELESTRIGGKIKPKNNEAFSYGFDGAWKKLPESDLNLPLSIGSAVSSTTEIFKTSEAIFEGKMLPLSYQESLKENDFLEIIGFSEFPFRDKTAYLHQSQTDGFQSVILYFPVEKTGFVFLLNAHQTDVLDVIRKAIGIYYGYGK